MLLLNICLIVCAVLTPPSLRWLYSTHMILLCLYQIKSKNKLGLLITSISLVSLIISNLWMGPDKLLPDSVFGWSQSDACVRVVPPQALHFLLVSGTQSTWVGTCTEIEPKESDVLIKPIFADAFGSSAQRRAFAKGADAIFYYSLEPSDNNDFTELSRWPSWRFAYSIIKGERSGWSDRDNWMVNYLGISHLFVVSGLHVGFVVILAIWLAKWIWKVSSLARRLFLYRRWLEWLLAMPASIVYVSWTGAGEPSIRAFMMAFIILTLRCRIVYLESMEILLFCAWSLLLSWPGRVLSASFWMSFLFVLLILLSLERLPRSGRMFLLQILFSLFALLFTLGWQHEVFALSAIINMLLVPFVAIVWFPYALLTALFSFSDLAVDLYGVFDSFLLWSMHYSESWLYQLPSIIPNYQTLGWVKWLLIICAFWGVYWLPLRRGIVLIGILWVLLWPFELRYFEKWAMLNGSIVSESVNGLDVHNADVLDKWRNLKYAFLPTAEGVAFDAIKNDWDLVVLDEQSPASDVLMNMAVQVITMQEGQSFVFSIVDENIRVATSHCFQFLNVFKTVACEHAEMIESMLN